jgi:hypothetical protein
MDFYQLFRLRFESGSIKSDAVDMQIVVQYLLDKSYQNAATSALPIGQKQIKSIKYRQQLQLPALLPLQSSGSGWPKAA